MDDSRCLPWLDHSLAPNGREVRENFADWFKGSRIVDATGAPATLLHGTRSTLPFDVFSPSSTGAHGPGIYMVHGASGQSSEYGVRTLELAARLLNPFIWHASDESYDATVDGDLLDAVLGPERAAKVVDRMDRDGVDTYGTEVQAELRKRGHDGIVVVPPWSPGFMRGSNVVIAWEPRQVKLVRGNSGLFSQLSASLSDWKTEESMSLTSRVVSKAARPSRP